MPPEKPPSIHVIAGVNGAGKSSIQGAAILEADGNYYNPDEAARKIIHPQPMTHLWWVAAAAIIGFLGNEAVAVFR